MSVSAAGAPSMAVPDGNLLQIDLKIRDLQTKADVIKGQRKLIVVGGCVAGGLFCLTIIGAIAGIPIILGAIGVSKFALGPAQERFEKEIAELQALKQQYGASAIRPQGA